MSKPPHPPRLLFINPWIHDFAAYDVWAKPLGLLFLAGIARAHGCGVDYIDCLDRFHPRASNQNPPDRQGRGPYLKTLLQKPAGFWDVRRRYARYGIPIDWFIEDLRSSEAPDLILMTSLMIYWYPGTVETIAAVKSVFPDTPLILGGIYPTLCRDHAEAHAGADLVVSGPAEGRLMDIIARFTGYSPPLGFDPGRLDTYPLPAFDLERKISSIPLLTAKGCPFQCDYCASRLLQPNRMTRNPRHVLEEIRFWHERYGVEDFAFYDDALLVGKETHAEPLLEGIIDAKLKLRFHTPNALHIREIDEKVAQMMFAAGFQTLRLGLEFAHTAPGERPDSKVNFREFERVVKHLQTAGFKKEQIGVYLLVGLPNQTDDAVVDSIQTVKNCGATPVMAYYTPIPGTAMWQEAVASSRYDLASDPVFTNNAVFPCSKTPFSWKALTRLKRLAAN